MRDVDVTIREIAGDAEILDVRDLPAPEPFEAIVLAARRLRDGEALWARTPRVPRVLLERAAVLGLAVEAWPLDDGSALLRVRRA